MKKVPFILHTIVDKYKSILLKIVRASIFVILLLPAFTVYSKNDIDSLQSLLSNVNPSEKLDLTLSLSKAYWSVSPAKGLGMARSAILLAQQTGNQAKKAKALLYGGVNYWAMGEFDKALNYYDSCFHIADNIGDNKLAAFAINNMGMIFQENGDSVKAMVNFRKALTIMKGFGDKVETAKIVNNIGKLNTTSHKYKEALEDYQTVIDLIKNTNERKLSIWVLNDIGEVYAAMNENDKAINYFNQGLQIANDLGDNVGKAMIYNSIGQVYLTLKKYSEAGITFQKSADIARMSKANDQLMIALKNLSDMFSQKHDFKQSLEYYKLFKEMSDSIFTENKSKNMMNIQVRYETEAKQKEIELLRKDLELKHMIIIQQNSVRNFLILLLLIATISSVIIFWQLQLKKKSHKQLAIKNEVIESQRAELAEATEHLKNTNKLLEEQQNEIQQHVEALNEVNRTKDRFFSIISHDLKSPFNSILGFSNVLVEQIQEKNYEGIENYVGIIQNSSQHAMSLLFNLQEWSQSQTGRMNFNPEFFDIVALCNEVLGLLNASAIQKSIVILQKIPESASIIADKAMISTVLRNLISNAIKFTNPEGEIIISVEKNYNELLVAISDNGVGIMPDILAKLFRIDESYSTSGTQNEKGTGLGLILCKEFIEKHNGKIWVESELGRGSTFYFTIPKNSER